MPDIIKTWPANVDAKVIHGIFREDNFSDYYFTLGRGKPSKEIERLWFTYQGRILGYFKVDRIVQNDGSLPRLRRLDGGESEWQIRPDYWVAICESGCVPLEERLYFGGFRGYRYFDIEEYRNCLESRVRI